MRANWLRKYFGTAAGLLVLFLAVAVGFVAAWALRARFEFAGCSKGPEQTKWVRCGTSVLVVPSDMLLKAMLGENWMREAVYFEVMTRMDGRSDSMSSMVLYPFPPSLRVIQFKTIPDRPIFGVFYLRKETTRILVEFDYGRRTVKEISRITNPPPKVEQDLPGALYVQFQ